MKRWLALLLLACAGLLGADEKKLAATPNTLTEKEVRDGLLLLFDGETTFGWKIDGEARVEDGYLVLGGKKETRARSTLRLSVLRVVNLEATWDGDRDDPTFYAHRSENGSMYSTLAWGYDNKLRLFKVNGSPSTPVMPDSSVLEVRVPAGQQVKIRNVKLKMFASPRVAEDMKPLFNGKDLKGWKVFEGKGKKSKFSVTKEGWLNVKDGPGDLQTTKLYADFVLQLECLSNGKYLNSGIFFRAIPGEYQNGYEAQIHNRFDMKPPRKYTVEEYDPKTHKPTGKKTVESTARDWGTGAIYRRVPARKAVAKDGEWFTMTVVARGRHIATWVNGVQQVDWTDNRPADKNPRKGYRDEAGAISIQGHDPTTDLSFRNIRVAELPRKK
jgi:hypothetical protein